MRSPGPIRSCPGASHTLSLFDALARRLGKVRPSCLSLISFLPSSTAGTRYLSHCTQGEYLHGCSTKRWRLESVNVLCRLWAMQ